MEIVDELQRKHAARTVAAVQAIGDPTERISAIRRIIDLDHEFHAVLAQIRSAAVRELLLAHTAAEVAELLNITVQRVGQLAARSATEPGGD